MACSLSSRHPCRGVTASDRARTGTEGTRGSLGSRGSRGNAKGLLLFVHPLFTHLLLCPLLAPLLVTLAGASDAGGGGGGGGGGGDPQATSIFSDKTLPEGPFVYVYDIGGEYGRTPPDAPQWYSEMYDVEARAAALLQDPSVRTTDPEKAWLFFIPFQSTWHLLHSYSKRESWEDARREVGKAWTEVLQRVQRQWPYFNRTFGRDHFGLALGDQGRCDALSYVSSDLFGETFFVTLNGDLLAVHNMPDDAVNWDVDANASMPAEACYSPGRDVVVPPYSVFPTVAPDVGERSVVLQFRFPRPGAGTEEGGRHYEHHVRRELHEMYSGADVKGWDFSLASVAGPQGWSRAVFSATPPAHAQWTPLFTQSILSGSIPVSFTRMHHHPFHDLLNYPAFSLNVDPADAATLRGVVDAVAAKPERVQLLQRNLAQVQPYFQWTGVAWKGAEALLWLSLRHRAAAVRSYCTNARRLAVLFEKHPLKN